jgi:hypothetical protein
MKSVSEEVSTKVNDQITDVVSIKVRNNLWGQEVIHVGFEIRNEVWHQVGNKIHSQVRIQVCNRVMVQLQQNIKL